MENGLTHITLGQITGAVGIKGELRVYPYTDYKERFSEIKELQIEDKTYTLERVRYMKDMVVLKLEEIEDRNAAEGQKGKKLYLKKEDAWEVPEDTYFISQLLGLSVVDERGELVGTLVNVIKNSAQDLYEIENKEQHRFLLPAVKEFVLSVDIEKKIMVVKLIEGILDL